MSTIILASKSPARLKLLRQVGFCVRPVPAGIKEIRSPASSCRCLVKENALRKAEKVAGNFSRGIVIGADTLVKFRDEIIGKPRNKNQAFRILSRLCSYPHWVYTGVAVIDVHHSRMVVDYEKTKVFMRPLSRSRIKQYIDSVSVQDLAGGFNIQDKGALFIERIEGCFYNVVGLPLAKLSGILETMHKK